MITKKLPDKSLLRQLDIFAIIISIIVLTLVVMMRSIQIDLNVDLSKLPVLHASLNTIVTICLIIGYGAIKRRNIPLHRIMVVTAMILSILFLCSYVLYHISHPATPYCKEGSIRYLYFLILITHIVLAAIILPFILFTFNRAYTGFFEKHTKLAKWVFPVWLYVAITGPVVYLMLRPCYS